MHTEAASAAPQAQRGRFKFFCVECGAEGRSHKAGGMFCSVEHKNAYNNRLAAEAKPLMTLLKAWRLGRNVKTADTAQRKALKRAAAIAFQELCRAADASNAADHAAGRPSALKIYVRRLRSQGLGGMLED